MKELKEKEIVRKENLEGYGEVDVKGVLERLGELKRELVRDGDNLDGFRDNKVEKEVFGKFGKL